MRALRPLPLLLLVACGGGRVAFPEGVDASTARLHGTSIDDMWWPDCDSTAGLDLWHSRGGAWTAVTVPDYQCGIMSGSQIPMTPEGRDVLWISGIMADGGTLGESLKLLRVTADGDIEDHTADLAEGIYPWVLASSGGHVYAVTHTPDVESEALAHFVDGQLEETIPLPPRSEFQDFPQSATLAVHGASDLFIDYGLAPCTDENGSLGDQCPTWNTLWHYDGQDWSPTDGPPVAAMGRAFPPDDVWAIALPSGEQAAWHWDGTAWTRSDVGALNDPAANPDLKSASLFMLRGLSADRQGNPIAIGGHDPGGTGSAVVEATFELRGDLWQKTGVITSTPPRSGCTGVGPCGINIDARFEDGSMALTRWQYNQESSLVLWGN